MSTQQRFALRWKLCTSGTFEGESHPRLGDVGAAEMAAAIEAKVPRDARVVLMCASGNRSALAAVTLREMGYENVASLAGGFRDWVASGGEVAD
jgi:rhodanese-related sulfurtransferase